MIKSMIRKFRSYTVFTAVTVFCMTGCQRSSAQTIQPALQDDTLSEDGLLSLTDYRLCSQKMETGGKTVCVELWLDEGVYGSGEAFGWGGGIYEENFDGTYRLLVRDQEGTILSERDLGRQNFSGEFEILVEDYNQDVCPDFTIGAFASSSTNSYTMYTLWENAEIGVIGEELLKCGSDFSTVFQRGEGTAFYGSIWNNAIGEEEQILYEWDAEQKIYKNT